MKPFFCPNIVQKEGIYLLILLSPAKTMNFTSTIPMFLHKTEPVFLEHALFLNKILRKMKSMELKTALNLSEKQIQQVKNNIQNFSVPNTGRQAIYAYIGTVYKGIDILNMNEEQINFAQDHIRILSGLYGILKPLDLIQEYRLDMKSKINIPNSSNLYKYWNNIISDYLIRYKRNETIINLASKEFSKIIDFSQIKTKIVDISFSELNNDKLTSPPMYSKMARGKMTRFIIRNFLTNTEQIKKYNLDGYSFNNNLSSDNSYIFTRE